MPGRLAGKVAIITGAGRGMGQAGAMLFAAEGANVVAVDRRLDAATATVDAIHAAGGSALALEADVTEDESVAAMVRSVVEAHGRIDVLWNNVGGTGWQADGTRKKTDIVQGGSDILSINPAEWDWQIRINLTSVYLCCRHVIPVMIKAGKGSIVSTSSGAAAARSANFHPYAVAKGGVITLAKIIATTYGAHGIRSNVLVPGLIASWNVDQLSTLARDRTLLGRIGELDEVAQAALFLASDESSYITGEAIHLDGGGHIGAR